MVDVRQHDKKQQGPSGGAGLMTYRSSCVKLGQMVQMGQVELIYTLR